MPYNLKSKKMKKLYFLSLLLGSAIGFAQTNVGITGNVGGVYINEIHYDNASTDVGEFIEVAGPAGTDLSTYTLTLYNGSNNTSYATIALTGSIPNEANGVGAVSFDATGIQNGAPDAIALSKTGTGSTNVQYLSYEGVMTAPAVDGPAMGLNSVDIIAMETSTTPIGYSLEYDETSMAWIVITDDTPGLFAQGPVLSTKTFDAIAGLSLYPNPVTGNVLNITSAANLDMNVAVFDIVGKQVINTKVINNTLNVSSLNAGVYIVKVTEDGKTATRKLVVR
ncbi:T9SS type A sorting domain-containing protein [Flavobacterium gelidilacus]